MQILRVCWATQTESRPQHNDVQQLQQQQQRSFTHSLHSIHQFSDHFTFFILPKANSAFHPSGVGKWVPALAGKAKAGIVHSVSGWMRGVQVKLCEIPWERVPYLSALVVCSWRGATQIHVYLYLYLFSAQLAELIAQPVKAVCVCLCVNQGSTNHNCYMWRLVILRAQTHR